MVKTISLDPKILVLKADTDEEFKEILELIAIQEKEYIINIQEQIKKLSLAGQQIIKNFVNENIN